MNIGIVVYSRTGHTLSVAARLAEKLAAAGHVVSLEQIETVVPLALGATTAELKTRPAVDGYEALVLACPVQGGLPSPPMAIYLDRLESLQGKQVALLVTGFFPAGWGRNQTLSQLEQICQSKGATVRGSGSVRWSSWRRGRQIALAVDHLSALFAAR